MKITSWIDLKSFEFWSGAIQTRRLLTDKEMDELEDYFNEVYPEGIDETELNDIFWFDGQFIAEFLGYEDEEQFWEDRNR